jgi:nucleoside-diphosphate-sugar epimerase
VAIHILGNGPITARLFQSLSSEIEVFFYTEHEVRDNIPSLSYSELNLRKFGDKDIFVLAWRGMPTNDSKRMKVLEHLSKKLTKNQKLIHLSSVAVYGNTPSPAFENQELSPINDYGKGKESLERFCDQTLGSMVFHLRISNVFGDPEFDDVINRIMHYQKTREFLDIVQPKEIERDYVSIDTLITILRFIIFDTRRFQNSKVFNISAGESITLDKLIKIIDSVTKLRLNFSEIPLPLDTISRSLISNEKIKKFYPVPESPEIIRLQSYVSEFFQ